MKNIVKITGIKLMLICLMIHTIIAAQFKMNTLGNVGIGTTSPLVRLHAVGDYAVFTSDPNGPPQSAALIRFNKVFSNASKPEYTFWGDDATGLFHQVHDRLGISVGGWEVARFEPPYQTYVLQVFGNAYIGGVWVQSDSRLKKSIQKIETPLTKIKELNGVSYEFRREEYKERNLNDGRNYGYLAQEVAKVLPEIVKKDDKDLLSINYIELIPFLTEAIKEQQKQIEELTEQVKRFNTPSGNDGNKTPTDLGASNIKNIDTSVLYQNAPNPFNSEAVIKFYIKKDAGSAQLVVYDVKGIKKKNVNIQDRGDGATTIAANELGKGVYYYSLIVDNKIVDSKTMLITE